MSVIKVDFGGNRAKTPAHDGHSDEQYEDPPGLDALSCAMAEPAFEYDENRIIEDIFFWRDHQEKVAEATVKMTDILNMLERHAASHETHRLVQLRRKHMSRSSLESLCATLARAAPGLWVPQHIYFIALATEYGTRMQCIEQFITRKGSLL